MTVPVTGREDEIAQISVQHFTSPSYSGLPVTYQAHLTKEGIGTTRLIESESYQEPTQGSVRDQIVMALLAELQNRGLSINELNARE